MIEKAQSYQPVVYENNDEVTPGVVVFGGKLPTADRMADAYDKLSKEQEEAREQQLEEAADKILESVRKGEKPRKVSGSINYFKLRPVKTRKPATGSAFNVFTFGASKLLNAFGRAAAARQAYVKGGGDPSKLRKRDRFITKALGFEFGGDFLRRTKGRFSSNPTKFQDPSLSKEQRFQETLFGERDINKGRVGTKATNYISGVLQRTKDLITGDDFLKEDETENLAEEAAKSIDKTAKLISETQQDTEEQQEINRKFISLIKEQSSFNNEYLTYLEVTEDTIKVKEELFDEQQKEAERAQSAADANKGIRDSAGTLDIAETGEKAKKGGFNIPSKIFRSIAKRFIRWITKQRWYRKLRVAFLRSPVGRAVRRGMRMGRNVLDAIRNPRQTFNRGMSFLNRKVLQPVTGFLGSQWNKWIATPAQTVAEKSARLASTLKNKAGTALDSVLKKIPKNWTDLMELLRNPKVTRVLDVVGGPIAKFYREQLTNPRSISRVVMAGFSNAKVRAAIMREGGEALLKKAGAKLGIKVGGQAAPLIGQAINVGYGVIEAIVRGALGDWKGAALSLGGAIPVAGAAFGVVDILRDINEPAYTEHIESNLGSIFTGDSEPVIKFFNAVAGTDVSGDIAPSQVPVRAITSAAAKLSSGGINAQVGEAGNELIVNRPMKMSSGGISSLYSTEGQRAVNDIANDNSGGLNFLAPTVAAIDGMMKNPILKNVVGPGIVSETNRLKSEYRIPTFSGNLAPNIKPGLIQSAKSKANQELSQEKSTGFFTNMFTSVGQFIDDAGEKLQRAINDPLGTAGRLFGRLQSGVAGLFGMGGGDRHPFRDNNFKQVSQISTKSNNNVIRANNKNNFYTTSVNSDPTVLLVNSQTIIVMPDESAPSPPTTQVKNMTLSETLIKIQGRRLSGAI